MHILIATDGTLDPERVADAVARWHTEGDVVEVFTAVSIPTDFLKRLGDSGVREAASIALEAGQGFTAGDRAAERLAPKQPMSKAARSDSPVLQAITSTAESRTKPVISALARHGITATWEYRTTEKHIARTVLQEVALRGSELLLIGSHGQGRFEGLLGSTGTKLVRRAGIDMLVIRQPADGQSGG